MKGLPALIKHSSVVSLSHNIDREDFEIDFRTTLYNTILEVAEEVHITIDEHQIYNCMGFVELMRKNKGIAIVGPSCSGKTQLIKLASIVLRRAFKV